MKASSVKSLFTGVILCAVTFSARADREQDLISILQSSSASIPAKCDACKQLREAGGAKAVPALAPLLDQNQLSHAARYALEGMPCPEALDAMRSAAQRTGGPNKAGLLDSLGWRRDTASLPLLMASLNDPDAMVASAAATALGRIGGRESIKALMAVKDASRPAVRPAVYDALLRCGDSLLAGGDEKGAAAIYRNLRNAPDAVRVAAWRGEVMATRSAQPKMILSGLQGQDAVIRAAALHVLRESGSKAVVSAGLKNWAALAPDAQTAVLARSLQIKADTAKAIQLALNSSAGAVRVAGWEAVAEANDLSRLPAAAEAAASTSATAAERDAAREALARFRGPSAGKAVIAQLAKADTAAQAELLGCLGQRNDKSAASVLLDYAARPDPSIRSAALESLRVLAVADTAVPLLRIAASQQNSEDALAALFATCQAAADRARISTAILNEMGGFSDVQKICVFPILAELGTPATLQAALAGAQSPNADLRKAAIRTLGEWPGAAPSADLLAIARASDDTTLKVLAVRAAIRTGAQDPDASTRLALMRQAIETASRPDEKRAALGQIGQIATAEALSATLSFLADPELANEAALASVSIAEKFAKADPKLAAEAATRVLAATKEPAVVKRAWELRGSQIAASPFIQDWLVCGPYTIPGAAGAASLFDPAFGPEKNDEVQWKSMPRADQANLSGIFPGHENCVAYLKAEIIAPAGVDAMLLTGSDDGIKAWLNDELVHSNNADRGAAPDQDKAPIHLKPGLNVLMLKVTQGGGGWSACARIVGADGAPVPGLRVQQQTAPAATLENPKP